ncbi:MAG: YbhB/YbcL family Raf kinase inhibitor-like protein [Candidatus Dadabacteria bacterium]|nr:YbhB/YbcL family Raf kinase inhibitor-like protein [Candidatus Dadabacteria bacterium]NIS08054.1 YbhB/YbcL family Raf kinase inhibitor-like protein [Candidatus Dadabacteria bacterium]NIY22494.1 YbhB/YbcL family Raf kinase inhibitor-like protein [Candidatus Dadabacteria bacterium]
MGIKLTSPAFEEGGMIPGRYTCDGDDISPQLNWGNIPDNIESIAIIMDDPDAPRGTWVHWVIYNINPNADELPENIDANKTVQGGAIQGKNSWGTVGYGGPCPPGGVHRYFFKIYALDTKTFAHPGATKEQLLESMSGHILDEGQLMGRYKRA